MLFFLPKSSHKIAFSSSSWKSSHFQALQIPGFLFKVANYHTLTHTHAHGESSLYQICPVARNPPGRHWGHGLSVPSDCGLVDTQMECAVSQHKRRLWSFPKFNALAEPPCLLRVCPWLFREAASPSSAGPRHPAVRARLSGPEPFGLPADFLRC